jgi:long-chain acyl-CoA synthetase
VGESRELSFWQRGASDPGRVAVVDVDGTVVTYGELLARSNRMANGLRSFGLASRDAVAVLLPNCRQVYETFLAAVQIGLYYVPINFHLTADEVEYVLTDAGAEVLVGHAQVADTCRAAAKAAGIPSERCLAVGDIEGFRSFDEFLDARSDATPDDRRPGQRMYYTSGTTGRPKGVRRAFPEGDVDADAVAYARNQFEVAGLDSSEGGVHLVLGPVYHAAPLGFSIGALHLGQTIVLMDKWSPEGTLELIERHRATNAHFVPTMFHRLLKLDDEARASYDLSSLRTITHAAAPCPVEVKREMIEWLGPIVYEYYAATEGGGTRVSPEEWLERPGTVGRASPGAAIKVLDDDGAELLPGTPGKVYMKALTPFEYHNDPAKTAANRVGDLLTVGDIGYLDEDGYLFLCDRDSNLIISGGVNIYPAEIEAVLIGHPKVRDVAVFGVPNPEWGEEVKAVVEPMPAATTGAALGAELIEYCQERIAAFKCPRSVDFVEQLPRDDSGKLYKRRLRDQYWSATDRRL